MQNDIVAPPKPTETPSQPVQDIKPPESKEKPKDNSAKRDVSQTETIVKESPAHPENTDSAKPAEVPAHKKKTGSSFGTVAVIAALTFALLVGLTVYIQFS